MHYTLENFISDLKGDNNIDKDVSVGGLPSTVALVLNETEIKDEQFNSKSVTIDKIRFNGNRNLEFENCSFNKLVLRNITGYGVKFINCQVDELLINGQLSRVEISSGFTKKLQVLPCSLNVLVISGKDNEITCGSVDASSNYVKTLQIFDSEIGELTLSRSKNESRRLEIENIKVGHLKLLSIRHGNDIKFKKIQPIEKNQSLISIEGSTLTNVHFQDSDFSKFKHLLVKNSSLDGLKSDYIIWFKRIIKEDETEDFLAYRQLKGAMRNQHDSISETYFRAKEQNAYLNSLKGSRRFGERIMLFLNKISNNHGVSWTRGLLFTTIISIFCFLLYLFSINIDNKITFHSPMDYLGYFSQFFIITHNFDFMSSVASINGLSYFIDVIGRILIGYGIYQTVQAFRKYGKG